MRIIYITHYSALLGANRSLLTLVKGVRDSGIAEVMVLCPAQGLFTEELQKYNIPFQVFNYKNWMYSYRSKNFYLFSLIWYLFKKNNLPDIIEFVQKFNPDIIHSNSSVVSLGWQLAEALKKRHVWHIREYGYADYLMVPLLGKKHFYKKLAQADLLIFISQSIRKYYQQSLPSNVSQTCIYNGVFDQLPEPREIAGKYFLIIGMLHPNKGQMDALKAIRLLKQNHPDIRLKVVGTGWKSYTRQLKHFTSSNGLKENVEFMGYVAEPAPLFCKAAAVLMCSRHEGMGRVTAEAMAMGVPVIGYREGATEEIITTSGGGVLYESVGELAQQMEQLWVNKASEVELGRKGREFAEKNFSNHAYIRQVNEAYRRLQEE